MTTLLEATVSDPVSLLLQRAIHKLEGLALEGPVRVRSVQIALLDDLEVIQCVRRLCFVNGLKRNVLTIFTPVIPNVIECNHTKPVIKFTVAITLER